MYSNKILNEQGLKKYWSYYESAVHNKDRDYVEKRQKMYKIEYEYIRKFLAPNSAILDVGCADGAFLDFFKDDEYGFDLSGVEFGDEAYNIAKEKGYSVKKGELPDLDFADKKFDLIIFRGTIQYFIDPERYFLKAISLLKPEGQIYICSSPNANSLCVELFRDKFTLPVGPTDYQMFTPESLIKWFSRNGCVLMQQMFFYEETPYADVPSDTKIVQKALEVRKHDGKIDFKSPPFYDNMLTMIFKKIL